MEHTQKAVSKASKIKGLKIIGAGFGRTGTLSLKAALEELGFGPCYHMSELFQHPQHFPYWEATAHGESIEWNNIFEGYEATVDWPASAFYENLMAAYPDAKVLLSVRDPEKWYESVSSTIYKVSTRATRIPLLFKLVPLLGNLAPPPLRVGHLVKGLIWEGTFGGAFEDKEHAIAVFNQHNKNVKKRVPPGKLLVYDVKEGWEPLCRFLGVEVPNKPFPHLNDRANFMGNRMRQQQFKRLVRVLAVAGIGVIVLLVLLALRRLLKRES